MTNNSRLPWSTPIAFHSQHQSHHMADTTHTARTQIVQTVREQEACSLAVTHKIDCCSPPTNVIRLLLSVNSMGVWKCWRKKSIDGTRRYAETLQCSNTGHVLFVATQDGLFAACSDCW
jgi:hypothetical protein